MEEGEKGREEGRVGLQGGEGEEEGVSTHLQHACHIEVRESYQITLL